MTNFKLLNSTYWFDWTYNYVIVDPNRTIETEPVNELDTYMNRKELP